MIYYTKIDNNDLIIKILENNNQFSIFIKIQITKLTLDAFKNLYHNLHKNLYHKEFFNNNTPPITIELKDNFIIFDNNGILIKLIKNNDIVDMFDKIITNLMINNLEFDSPTPNTIEKFEK
jgi:hypothetical protein